jgi:N utilization substance protein A
MTSDQAEVFAFFSQEVPEVAEGAVEIKAIARKPGVRSKVAVYSHDPSVDCVGACVGVRGCRIRRIVDRLDGERIDLVRWDESLERLISNSLQPAVVEAVVLHPAQHRATVVVKEDQLSLATGLRGVNRELASRICAWDIEITAQPTSPS